MPKRTDLEIEQEILSYNGLVTQEHIATLFNISLPTIQAIYRRNNIRWIWQRRDQWGENNTNFQGGMARSTIERLTRRVVQTSGRCLYTCERCNKYNEYQEHVRHHKNRDRSDNERANLEVLCLRCHTLEHNPERIRGKGGQYVA